MGMERRQSTSERMLWVHSLLWLGTDNEAASAMLHQPIQCSSREPFKLKVITNEAHDYMSSITVPILTSRDRRDALLVTAVRAT